MLWRNSKTLTSSITSEDVCLNHLKLSRRRYEELNEERVDKREYIRKVIETSLPSFGRFMSEVYLIYDSKRDKTHRNVQTKDYKQLLEAARNITKSDTPSGDQLLQLAVLAYKLSRMKA